MDTWTYEYDANGMRTKRYCDWCGYQYIYSGSQLTQMKFEGSTLNFTYDASGTPLTMSIDGTVYYYVTNLQGDVVGLLDATGAQVVTYTYDAWGVGLTVTGTKANSIGMLNPLRYRGYVYDVGTGLYYLQSRYYDPQIGRFINADDVDYLGADGTPLSNNLFAYCTNNPVNLVDSTGHAPKWWQSILVGAAVIAVTAIVTAAIVTTGGGAVAILATAGKIALGAAKIATAAGAISGTIRACRSMASGETDSKELGKDFVIGFADGFNAAATASMGYSSTSIGASYISGQINNGYGWSRGKWEGGYQTPATPGISIVTHNAGKNGGRSFGVDLDIYNGLHYHTNKFGFGKSSKWIKQHHWGLTAGLVGLITGFSEERSEW